MRSSYKLRLRSLYSLSLLPVYLSRSLIEVIVCLFFSSSIICFYLCVAFLQCFLRYILFPALLSALYLSFHFPDASILLRFLFLCVWPLCFKLDYHGSHHCILHQLFLVRRSYLLGGLP